MRLRVTERKRKKRGDFVERKGEKAEEKRGRHFRGHTQTHAIPFPAELFSLSFSFVGLTNDMGLTRMNLTGFVVLLATMFSRLKKTMVAAASIHSRIQMSFRRRRTRKRILLFLLLSWLVKQAE